MSAFNFTSGSNAGIIPALAIQGWSETMAMSVNERARNYQRRQAEKFKLLSPEEQAAIRAKEAAWSLAYYYRNREVRIARSVAAARARRQAQAEAGGSGREEVAGIRGARIGAGGHD